MGGTANPYNLTPADTLRVYELSTIKPGLAIAYLSQVVDDSGTNPSAAAWLNAVARINLNDGFVGEYARERYFTAMNVMGKFPFSESAFDAASDNVDYGILDNVLRAIAFARITLSSLPMMF